MKPLSLFSLLFFGCLTVSAQVEIAIELLNSCDRSSSADTLKIDVPRSDGQLLLPLNWVGLWKGDNPALYLTKENAENKYRLDIFNAWDPYNKGELFDIILSEHPEGKFISIDNADCLVLSDYKKVGFYNIAVLLYEDNSDAFENRTMWTFGLSCLPQDLNEEVLCEVRCIIEQFIELYGKRKN